MIDTNIAEATAISQIKLCLIKIDRNALDKTNWTPCINQIRNESKKLSEEILLKESSKYQNSENF